MWFHIFGEMSSTAAKHLGIGGGEDIIMMVCKN